MSKQSRHNRSERRRIARAVNRALAQAQGASAVATAEAPGVEVDISGTGRRASFFPKSAGYDATVDKKRRQPPRSVIYSEDKHLDTADRKKLVATARDQQRNFAIMAWSIRKHLDYVSRFTFQARNEDAQLNRDLEAKIDWWGSRRNCDLSGRMNLKRMVRIGEQCKLIDGDILFQFMRSGHLQAIEGDRIRKPTLGTDFKAPAENFTHGIETDKRGAHKRYCVCKRTDGGGYTFDTWVNAAYSTLRGYFQRFDQLRGITPLSVSINTNQDLYEGFDVALVKAKLHNIFGLGILREKVNGRVNGFDQLDQETGEAPTSSTTKYDIKFNRGPFLIDGQPGDKFEMFESKSPSGEFRSFSEMMIRCALLSCDIPYTFFDVKGSTYSGARQDLLQYIESAKAKREDNQELLDEIVRWKCATWIASGFLTLPGKMTLQDLSWEWVPTGIPWIDPKKEIDADIAAVNARLTSRQRVCRRRGEDWFEIADELEQEEKRLPPASKPLAVAAFDEEAEHDELNEEELTDEEREAREDLGIEEGEQDAA